MSQSSENKFVTTTEHGFLDSSKRVIMDKVFAIIIMDNRVEQAVYRDYLPKGPEGRHICAFFGTNIRGKGTN